MIVCWLTLQILAASPVVNTVFIKVSPSLPPAGRRTGVKETWGIGVGKPNTRSLVSSVEITMQTALNTRHSQTPHFAKMLQTASSSGPSDIAELANWR
jgi:hypothetical protein